MTRGTIISAVGVVVAAVLGVIYTVAVGNQPLLGLDLQGGVSVVLEPTNTSDEAISDETLDLTVELLRNRIDEIGVAEPEISRQGQNIVVSLPGVVEDQEEALDRLQQTAELRFRPVVAELGPAFDPDAVTIPDADDAELDESDTSDESDTGDDADTEDSDSQGSDAEGSTEEESGDAEDSFGFAGRLSPVLPAQDDTGDDAEEDPAVDAEEPAVDDADEDPAADAEEPAADGAGEGDPLDADLPPIPTEQGTIDPNQLAILEACAIPDVTADDDDIAEDYVVLADDRGNRYCLGPTLLTGEVVETADVGLAFTGTGWQVNPVFKPGDDGINQFNDVAAQCFNANSEVCPSTRLAVVLDHNVISAPSINAPQFARNQIVISGDFEEPEARRLAEALRFGALPLELIPQETRTVSASIGRDVMQSGVVAGLIGLALVAIYLMAYYRLAGLVAIGGLLISGALLWTIVAWFGEQFGLALTLAGVVGLIVAVGVSADSNIVYFENVKESYMSGRRVPTAVERAYQSAISTIVKADVVSLIAAVLLYLLTVGAVRGFAFYLGLATILDLIISWTFMRPALLWLARRSAVDENPRLLGLPNFGGTKA